MSSYAGIYVNDKEVFTYRNEVFPEVLCLFTRDEFQHLKGQDALPYASNWLTSGIDELEAEEIAEIEVQAYRTTASVLRDRLNVLGFGEPLVRRVVEQLAEEELEREIDLIEHFDDDEIKSQIQQQVDVLRSFDYESWKAEVCRHIAAKKGREQADWRDRGPLTLCESADERVLLRIIVDQVADDEPIVLDVSELFEGGWMDGGGNTDDAWQANLEAGASPPIVITEGSYDAHVLQGAIEVLKPHLSGYIRFLDYEMGNEGSASAAVRTLKSFAAAGISNRIVAVFDNDSAAYEAVMALRGTKLPAHYAVTHYPDLKLADAYPTLGPQGETVMNVNRLAGSIELYLGKDVLTAPDGNLTPVQWKGYLSKVGAYQGEIMNKTALQNTFRRKVKDAKQDRTTVEAQDWSGLALILDALVNVLSTLPARN